MFVTLESGCYFKGESFINWRIGLERLLLTGMQGRAWRLKISREQLVEFVEQSFDEINAEQKRNRSISRSFQICGLDPWSTDLREFKEHLDSLSTNRVYEALIQHQKTITGSTVQYRYLKVILIQQSFWILRHSYNNVSGLLWRPTTRIFRKIQSKYFVVYGIANFHYISFLLSRPAHSYRLGILAGNGFVGAEQRRQDWGWF